VVLAAAAIYLGCVISPPSLMDDVDAVQAQIARNMLESGDWVTARLNGIKYLEKSPLKYWLMAASYSVFGVRDWAGRIPLALSVIALCWLAARFGAWAFSARSGLYAGLVLATCLGLWLFTRIQIPDAMLTAAITLALWSFLRALDDAERRPGLWSAVMAASIAVGLLLKGLIAAVFPLAAAGLYLIFSRQLFSRAVWRRLHPFRGILIVLVIAAPWHILAILNNPPYFDFTMGSAPGHYRGFFWFYFLNEHLFRFLNMRYPRDYNTVPRALFWLLHLLWLLPWSVFLPAAARLEYRPLDRAGRTRLIALCWIGFLLVFFSFSTTQEYYSMPCYPALAMLLGDAFARGGAWIRRGSILLSGIAAGALAAVLAILALVWNMPAPGDISQALTQHPEAYTLSLGHVGDLTVRSFAYLRTPLLLAGIAFLCGAAGAALLQGSRLAAAITLMMVLFLHAARLALVTFDPYMGSRPLAEALLDAPPGELIVDNQYYTFSSVFFYTNRKALLLNGRVNNLEYGSYEPGAPQVFLDDDGFARVWRGHHRCYLLAEGQQVPRLEKLVGKGALHQLKTAGGKFLFSNRAL
jgi:4-amino-4-deoxy-L-arabinose transferase-like glycosyltransferase